jgi:hypothetical protein
MFKASITLAALTAAVSIASAPMFARGGGSGGGGGHPLSSVSAKRLRRRLCGASCDHWPIEVRKKT